MNLCEVLGVEYTDEREYLLSVVSDANLTATMNNQNASKVSLLIAAASGASFAHSIAAAMLTFGPKHGPIGAAREIIYDRTNDELDALIENGTIMPGWGNSFYRASIDPAWILVDEVLRSQYSEHYTRIENVGKRIFKIRGLALYPNASAYSAVACEVVGIKRGSEVALAVVSRISAWASLYVDQVQS